MPAYTKISIILKDSLKHDDYNKRIIEYLNDRHMELNDNMFTIAIDVADDSNINDFVLKGMQSVPAMKISNEDSYIYGVNSIVSTLAKLEMTQKSSMTNNQNEESKISNISNNVQSKTNSEEDVNPFYKMALEEMKSDDQEDPDTPSTIKPFQQDFSEAPLTDKMIEKMSQQYNKIYEERKSRNSRSGPVRQNVSKMTNPSTKKQSDINVDNFIRKGGYDKGEEMLMRQIAQNLQ